MLTCCLFYFASKLSPVCKEWPGLPSTGGEGFERRSARLLDENATDPGIEAVSLALQADSLSLSHQRVPGILECK